MSKNTETEDRLTAEWEPEVKVRRCGLNARNMRRKLITTGIFEIEAPELIDKIEAICRSGGEARITRHGEGAIRCLPVAEKDLSSIGLVCQSMGSLRDALRDLKIKFFKRFGKRVKKSEVIRDDAGIAERCDDFRDAVAHITPDLMVTCPECGTQFRIGKQLK